MFAVVASRVSTGGALNKNALDVPASDGTSTDHNPELVRATGRVSSNTEMKIGNGAAASAVQPQAAVPTVQYCQSA